MTCVLSIARWANLGARGRSGIAAKGRIIQWPEPTVELALLLLLRATIAPRAGGEGIQGFC